MIAILLLPILLLNLLAGLVAGLYLAYLGEWKVLGIGFIYGMFGHWILSIALMPTFLLAAPIVFSEKLQTAKIVTVPLAFLSQSYIAVLMAMSVLGVALAAHNLAPSAPRWTILLWTYAVATGPWVTLGRHEKDNTSTALMVFANQVSAALLIIVPLMYQIGVTGYFPFLIAAAPLVIAVIVNSYLAGASGQNTSRG